MENPIIPNDSNNNSFLSLSSENLSNHDNGYGLTNNNVLASNLDNPAISLISTEINLADFNQINGTSGRDEIIGTVGDDLITGGFGRDELTGGAGADIFVYNSIRDAIDVITDFNPSEDSLDFRGILTGMGYQGLDAVNDGYISFAYYQGGADVLIDEDGLGVGRSRTDDQSLDYEAETIVNLTLTATDANDSSLTYSKDFIINVININETSYDITLDNNTVEENTDGAIIGNLTVSDFDNIPEFTNNLVTVDDDRFEIINNNGTFQLKLKDNQSLDYENESTVNLILTATDVNDSSLTYSKQFVINVIDLLETVNNPPVTDADKTITLQEDSQPIALNINPPTDIDNDTLTITVTQLPDNSKGRITLIDGTIINVDNEMAIASLTSLIYTPLADANGNGGNFVYTVSDGKGGNDSQTISFIITPVEENNPPVTDADKTITLLEDSQPIELNINPPTDIDNDTLTITVTQLPDNSKGRITLADGTIINVGDEIAISSLTSLIYTPLADANGNGGNFVYTVSDGNGGTDSQIVSFIITPVNKAPTDIELSGNSVNENAFGATIGDITITDPDTLAEFRNNAVTVNDERFEIVNNGGTLQLKLKDDQRLDYETEPKPTVIITLTATDTGNSNLFYSENFTINVIDILEAPPTINALLADDTGISDTDLLTYDPRITGQTTNTTILLGNLNGNGFVDISTALNPNGSFFIDFEEYGVLTNGVFPDGDYILELKAGNNLGEESEITIVNFTLDLTPPDIQFDLAPESDTGEIGDLTTTEYLVNLLGQTDSESEVILLETQEVISPDANGNFTFTDVAMPSIGNVRYQMATLDKAGNQGRVKNILFREGINNAPEITSTPETLFDTTQQTTYTYQVQAIDPDGDNLSYLLQNAPLGAEINPDGLLSFEPVGNLTSSYTFTVQVDDGRGGIDSQTFTIDVLIGEKQNQPPEFTSSPIVEGIIDTEYIYQPLAIDPDNDELTFSIIESPEGMTIESETGLLLWTPTKEQIGDVIVNIQVSDEEGLTDTQSFVITVADKIINNSPIFISEPITDFAIGVPNTATGNVNPQLISLSLTDGDKVTQPVSITLPTGDSTGGQADIVFVVDESGSMDTEHQWLTNMVLELDQALQERGITDNRYSLIGYTSQTRLFNLAAQTQVSVYGPENQLVISGSFADVINNTQLQVNLVDGTYTVVINQIGSNATEYSLNANITDNDVIPLTNFNTVFTGTVAPLTEETYTFSASAGTQVIFDGLGATSTDIRSRLVAPNGTNLFSSVRLDSDTNSLILTEGGTYSLIVSGGNTGGNFSFQLLELETSATPITLDNKVSGSITTGLETKVFQFEATAGQNIYFDSTLNPNVDVLIYGQANQLIGSNSSLRDFAFNIPSDGVYSLILQNNVNQIANYDFKLGTPEIQQTTLAFGNTTTGNLSEAGEKHIYQIEGMAGQRIWFDGLASAFPSDIVANFFSPNGVQLLNSVVLNNDSSIVTLPESGTYSIVIRGNDKVGNYSFRILDLLTDAIDITSAINTPTEINSTFDGGLQTKLYQIQGTAGQQLVFDSMISSSGNWYLNGPDNVQLTVSTSLNTDFVATLPTDGIYTLLLDGASGSPFNFKFKVYEQIIEETPLTFGDTISGNLGTSGERDLYNFSGNAGQRILFDGLTTSNTSIRVNLTSPSGQVLINNISINTDSGMLILPDTGTYKLSVTGNNVTEDYSFRVVDVSIADSISLDTDINGANLGRDAQIYQFNGNAGQQILLDMVAVNSTSLGNWSLYGSGSNKPIANRTNLSDFNGVLPVDGIYTLVFLGNSNNPFDYTFNVRDITVTSPVTPSGFDTINSGNLATSTEEDIFTFDAVAGTRIIFDGLTSSSSSIRAKLTSPNNSQIFSNIGLTDDVMELIVAESGTYSVTVSGAIGDYSFRVLNLDNATPIPLGDVFNSSLSLGNSIEIYEFNGTAGQQLYFNGISSTGSGDWRLYSPENKELNTSNLNNNFSAALPINGTYKVLIDGRNATTFNYSVQILTTEIQNSIINLDEVINGSLNQPGNRHIYRFNGQAGQQLLFDGLGSNNLNTNSANARLISPSGVEVMSNIRTYQDSNPFILPQSGEYSLVVSVNDVSDNYSFRLLDLLQNLS